MNHPSPLSKVSNILRAIKEHANSPMFHPHGGYIVRMCQEAELEIAARVQVVYMYSEIAEKELEKNSELRERHEYSMARNLGNLLFKNAITEENKNIGHWAMGRKIYTWYYLNSEERL